jgi:hypothetical protein
MAPPHEKVSNCQMMYGRVKIAIISGCVTQRGKILPDSAAHDRACDRLGKGMTLSFASSTAMKCSIDFSRIVTTLAPV